VQEPSIGIYTSAEALQLASLALRFAESLRTYLPPEATDPDHGLAWRVKDADAILRKLQRRHTNRESCAIAVNDLLGIRVLTTERASLPSVQDAILRWATTIGLQLQKVQDASQTPDGSGYSAIHLDFQYCDLQLREGSKIGLEVQLTSWLQHLHGMLSHRLFYRADNKTRLRSSGFLNGLSQEFARLDLAITEQVWAVSHDDSRR
jgi:ppGpp synthetase/RelA/SpoT-type nucleotidyltranferase